MINPKVIVPVITPLKSNGDVDYESIEKFSSFLKNSGIKSIFVGGSTGEFVSLTDKNKFRAIEGYLDCFRDLDVYIGISDTSASRSTEFAKNVLKTFDNDNIKAFVATLPYYFKIESNNQVNHFLYIVNNVDYPLMLYNIPHLTNNQYIELNQIETLQNNNRIIGLKESSKNFLYFQEIFFKYNKTDFEILQGAEELMAVTKHIGGYSFVPGIANIIPDICIKLAKNDEFSELSVIQKKILDYMVIYSYGPWVKALKTILKEEGIILSSKSVIFDDLNFKREKLIIENYWKNREE